jgi:hypothetical protein
MMGFLYHFGFWIVVGWKIANKGTFTQTIASSEFLGFEETDDIVGSRFNCRYFGVALHQLNWGEVLVVVTKCTFKVPDLGEKQDFRVFWLAVILWKDVRAFDWALSIRRFWLNSSHIWTITLRYRLLRWGCSSNFDGLTAHMTFKKSVFNCKSCWGATEVYSGVSMKGSFWLLRQFLDDEVFWKNEKLSETVVFEDYSTTTWWVAQFRT